VVPTVVEPPGRTSFSPLLKDPKRPWKKAAFSQQPREIPGHGGAMGYSVRTARYRFTEWSVPGQDAIARELYDHQTDPLENENLAGNPEFARTAKELSKLLRGGWQAALPSPGTKP
jgi:iduronate 2-sulfatase